MAQRYIPSFIILVILLCLVSSTGADDYSPEINFWPVFYYNKDNGEKVIEVFYPFFSSVKRKDTGIVSFRPVYSVKKIPAEEYRRSEIIWPLSYAVRSRDRRYRRIFPFYTYTKDTTSDVPEKDIVVFPFFYSRNYNGEDFALFPFYGKFSERFGHNTIRFVLWPIYTMVADDDRKAWNVVWPIFNYSKYVKGDGYGYKFWPFYGKHEKKGAYEKGFIMWPFYTYIHADIKNVGKYKGWGAIPFYVSEKSPVSRARSILWPLFNHIKSKTEEYERWDYPFPIASKIKSEKRYKNSFLPFWLINRTPDSETLSIAFPFFWSFNYRTGPFLKIKTVRFVPLYWKRDEYLIKEGKHAGLRQVWPFFKQEEEFNHSTRLEVPSLYPLLHDEPWERNWGPFFSLYKQSHDTTTDVKTIRFLWRLFHKKSSPRFFYLEMAPLFSLYKDRSGEDIHFSFVGNMFTYKKNTVGRHIRLFHFLKIPLGPAAEGKRGSHSW
ncbi:MAG: hypothetical protein E3K32_02170 [wastewater metagenome]|nr:hypothetical protein [Candidatus Loosdrechtia aerotolerans]